MQKQRELGDRKGRPRAYHPNAVCSVRRCSGAARKRGWCVAHYKRWRRYGDPLGRSPRLTHADPIELRLKAQTDYEGPKKPNVHGRCWLWTGRLNTDGYGTLRWKRENLAHRIAWIVANKRVPPPQKPFVLHRCNTRACVRPAHLYVGTISDNARDSVKAGTAYFSRPDSHAARITGAPKRSGENHVSAKLTTETVKAVRLLSNNGFTLRSIGRIVHSTPRTIGRIVRGLSWSHS